MPRPRAPVLGPSRGEGAREGGFVPRLLHCNQPLAQRRDLERRRGGRGGDRPPALPERGRGAVRGVRSSWRRAGRGARARPKRGGQRVRAAPGARRRPSRVALGRQAPPGAPQDGGAGRARRQPLMLNEKLWQDLSGCLIAFVAAQARNALAQKKKIFERFTTPPLGSQDTQISKRRAAGGKTFNCQTRT